MCRNRALKILVSYFFYSFVFVNAQLGPDELQQCIDGFVVHRDKIIRTQDSRAMGAKYLTEVDVESRIDCMRWCCGTEHCDVFIFEEKKPGSCYLFHCGPPHDFKCKFTGHANYSSAVLTNYNLQSEAAIEEQIRRNQQEHELKSLRKLEPPVKEYNYYTNVPVSTTPAATPSTTSTTLEPIKIQVCSRNQFECRSSDDCIAIYNVCDGIPQCADGSDEAAELGCPVDRTTIPPPPPPPPPIHQIQVAPSPKPYIPMLPDVLRYQQMMQQQQQQQQHGQYPMIYPNGHIPEDGKNWAMVHSNSHQLPPNPETNYNFRNYPQPQQSIVEDSINNAAIQQQQQQLAMNNFKQVPGYQWNNYQQPPPVNYEGSNNENGNLNGGNKIGNNEYFVDVLHADVRNELPYGYEKEQQPPRIFNHKGSGIRLDEIEAANGIYPQDPNRGYAPSYYPAMVQHQENTWQQNNNNDQQQQQQQQRVEAPVPTPAPAQENTQEKIQVMTSSTSPPISNPSEKQDNPNTQSNDEKKPENHETRKKVMNSDSISLNTNHDSHPASDHADKMDSHKAHELELRTMADAHLQEHKSMAITDHIRRHSSKIEDLEISRPKGAVISLALGLTVTAVMAVLIACRLRVVKRRGRGRGHEFAHDADYLVNGMYL